MSKHQGKELAWTNNLNIKMLAERKKSAVAGYQIRRFPRYGRSQNSIVFWIAGDRDSFNAVRRNDKGSIVQEASKLSYVIQTNVPASSDFRGR